MGQTIGFHTKFKLQFMQDRFEMERVNEATGMSERLKSFPNRTGIFDSIVTQSTALLIILSILTFDVLSYNTLRERESGELCAMVL
jgi:hypothetical protein